MVSIKEITDYNDYPIGVKFSYTGKTLDQHDQIHNEKFEIYVISHEIKVAIIATKPLEEGYHNIYDNDIVENWDVVCETVKLFLEKAPKEFELIIDLLSKESKGYQIAKKIINNEIDKLEGKTKSLKKILRGY